MVINFDIHGIHEKKKENQYYEWVQLGNGKVVYSVTKN